MYSDITNTCRTPCVSVYSVLVPLDGLLFTGITTLLACSVICDFQGNTCYWGARFSHGVLTLREHSRYKRTCVVRM